MSRQIRVAWFIFGIAACLQANLFCSNFASAQEWPKKMFETTEHDFGTVARGSDTVYKFEVTNKFVEDIHLASVRSSCGCTTPSIEGNLIKTYEKAYVVAKFNTRAFTGYHSATLTVTIDKPYPAQIQLRVRGNIRGDVVFEPGGINFGTVDQGAQHEKSVRVRYAGRSGWEIKDVVTSNDSSDYYEVELNDLQRRGGVAQYELMVRLKETAPAGYLKDQLVLVTNDSNNPRIPLDIEGRVTPEISVMPENWVLGDVEPGSEVSKKLIVRGKTPFTITKIDCDDCFSFEFGDEAKTTHVVSLNFRAGEQPGQLKKQISIHTDRGETYNATCTAYANIIELSTPESDPDEGTSTAARESDSSLAGNQ
ncbi:DUF1573 domain-containing protein [Aeoliella mucimassa]|uniref:DUF1573 domain-containing protein n=1 Tax=Aeoliella mucimassa TaxID=2527972 RepID=A0A518ASS5_9BACT|nr:DUF1573 domain-containing protein [Aeoliella mucimassa]QDU57782.1 hypothetical protein Pan181_40040 [Aeoliella mucimassa]